MQVAAMQYYAQYRDDMKSLDQLNHVKTPISGYLGVVSTTYEVEYISGTAFSILPGGLLIDMRGINVQGCWRIDQPALYSSTHFLLTGHVGSSLEHETWQEITGYDAVSTVRGIQMALAEGATLVNPIYNSTSNNLASLYPTFGFTSGSAPSGFTYDPLTLWTTEPATWTDATQGSEFDLFESVVNTSTSSIHLPWTTYEYSTSTGLYAWCSCINTNANLLQTWINEGDGNENLGTQTVCNGTFSGTVSQYYSAMQSYYFNTVIPDYIGQDFFQLFRPRPGIRSIRLCLSGRSADHDPASDRFRGGDKKRSVPSRHNAGLGRIPAPLDSDHGEHLPIYRIPQGVL